jgi:glycerol-3-phosphate dehydrogenase
LDFGCFTPAVSRAFAARLRPFCVIARMLLQRESFTENRLPGNTAAVPVLCQRWLRQASAAAGLFSTGGPVSRYVSATRPAGEEETMKSRERARQSILQANYDVCVIGGGATGLGCALDAQLRGFSTVLLDAGDFVSCTSMASTKLVHGGVRYLRQAIAEFDRGQYALVRRALHERIHLLRRAPFLAHPLELLVPCFSLPELAYYTVGMKVYDWIAGPSSLFPSRMLSRAEALRRMPSLRSGKLAGCVSYADGQFDDARFGIALAQTFSQQAGELINYAKAVAFAKDSNGKLAALEVEDHFTGERFQIRASVFLNCTGPFADQVRRLANPALPERLRLSKGVHLLLPLEALQSESALLIPRTEDGRVIFAIPWMGSLLVGTTDDEAKVSDEMVVTPGEVQYLIGYVNQYLNVKLTPQDVQSAFAGLRPLVLRSSANSQDATSRKKVNTGKLIRDHEVEVDEASGLISVLGGKWTTYRAMAEDGIDRAQQALGRAVECRTLDFPLTGAEGFWVDYWRQLAEKYALLPRTAQHLAQKFGTDAPKVLELAEQEPRWLQPLAPGSAAIQAEVVYAIREEMAQSIEDILLRRIGVQFHGWKEAAEAAPVVGQLLAREFAWSESQSSEAVAAYLSTIQHLLHCAGLESQPERAGRS